MKRATSEQIMADYRSAYKAANGKTQDIGYAHGWYYFYPATRPNPPAYRGREIEAMTTLLRGSAKEKQ